MILLSIRLEINERKGKINIINSIWTLYTHFSDKIDKEKEESPPPPPPPFYLSNVRKADGSTSGTCTSSSDLSPP